LALVVESGAISNNILPYTSELPFQRCSMGPLRSSLFFSSVAMVTERIYFDSLLTLDLSSGVGALLVCRNFCVGLAVN